MNRIVKELVEQLDAETRAHLPAKYTLVLWGDLDKSPFLRAVKRKAEGFGINVVVNFYPVTVCRMIADKETTQQVGYVSKFEDVDRLQNDGLSGVAQAVWMLLCSLKLVQGKNITIVGRGHSVKGLANILTAHDATVTVAHSATPCLLNATKGRDVVVYATPKLDKVVACDTENLVIDLGGCVEHPEWFYCEYLTGIGPLTVSVLLNRFVVGR